ncbi:metal ABC transporter permease [Aetokthonos hydrillicola Thurmond2011]|jgi:zinc/manganese transport system permease protein|uniref:Metal ABC transporter permease n=2 Tax=Aetokthonos TaxID=1550243 RepID=A0AAP5IF73_9CYAN|nr:metal ABC transporter permease [Aetokthonos hydrillicola CCALA 1050]MBW4584309.1 metal ABC transporter permease [Aetokthonos hydrillicola CCALA 1050]MDR9898483.1 metal ABC transporter permease [Aetokthonos hydrillicola Thurmond2011]
MTLLLETQQFSMNLLQSIGEMLSVDFMRYAFLAGTPLAVLSGLIGYFVVLRNLVFASEALAHVTFTGALIAIIVGGDALLGLFGVTMLVGLAMGVLGTLKQSKDVEIGTVLAWVLGLGSLLLSIYTSKSSKTNSRVGVNYLFGSILGLQAQQAELIAAIGVVIIVVFLIIARPLLFASVDPEVATARGLPVRAINTVFFVLLALSIAEAVPAVGALLNSALLITPAAIAQRLVTRPFVALWLSAVLSLTFVWVGLTIGFYAPYPVSFLISTLAFVTYVTVIGWEKLHSFFKKNITKSLRGGNY